MLPRTTIVVIALLFYCAAWAQTPVSCPESIKVAESVAPVAGWQTSSGTTQHAFERISVTNGKQGGQEYDLAPDDEKQLAGKTVQTWKLKDYQSMNIFLRCRYHDTAAVLWIDLPQNLQTCSLSFTLDKKGAFAGNSAASCR